MSCKRYNTFEVLCPQEMELLGEWSSGMNDMHRIVGVAEDRLVNWIYLSS